MKNSIFRLSEKWGTYSIIAKTLGTEALSHQIGQAIGFCNVFLGRAGIIIHCQNKITRFRTIKKVQFLELIT